MDKRYVDYYMRQVGRGYSDIGPVFRSGLKRGVRQRGRGGFFSNILRVLNPLFTSGVSALKNQAIDSAGTFMRDVAAGNKPFRDIVKDTGREALTKLTKRGADKVIRKLQGGRGRVVGAVTKRPKQKRSSVSIRSTQVGRGRRRGVASKRKKVKKVKRNSGKKIVSRKRKRTKRSATSSSPAKKRKRIASRTVDIFSN